MRVQRAPPRSNSNIDSYRGRKQLRANLQLCVPSPKHAKTTTTFLLIAARRDCTTHTKNTPCSLSVECVSATRQRLAGMSHGPSHGPCQMAKAPGLDSRQALYSPRPAGWLEFSIFPHSITAVVAWHRALTYVPPAVERIPSPSPPRTNRAPSFAQAIPQPTS